MKNMKIIYSPLYAGAKWNYRNKQGEKQTATLKTCELGFCLVFMKVNKQGRILDVHKGIDIFFN